MFMRKNGFIQQEQSESSIKKLKSTHLISKKALFKITQPINIQTKIPINKIDRYNICIRNICQIIMDYEWYSLSNDKQKYQTGVFSDTNFGKRFSRLYHEYMLVAVASFGGPIAITSDKTQILTLRQDDPTIENIVLFNNEGQIINRIKIHKPFENVVICLDFTQNEFLVAIFRKGEIWIIDPHNYDVKKLDISGLYEREQIFQAKVFQNFFVVKTTQGRFLYTTSVFKPYFLEFLNPNQGLPETINNYHWTAFAPRSLLSEKIELHVVHPVAGIIQVIEMEEKKVYFGTTKPANSKQQLPVIRNIRYISNLSPNKKLIAYITADPIYKENPMDQIPQNLKKKEKDDKKKKGPEVQQVKIAQSYNYSLIICPSISSDSLDPEKFKVVKLPFAKKEVHMNPDQQPLAIRWCGSKALVLQFWNQELYLCSVEGDFIRIEKNRGDKEKWSYLKEQVDGLRILSAKENKILRQLPSAYTAIYEPFSEQPGALLYAAFQAFQDQAPLQDDQIRKDKNKLKIGIDQCVRASRFQLNFQNVTKLMRAATYGKAFLPPNLLPNNIIYENAKLQRIVFHIRQKMMRYITLDQFVSLKDDQLLNILLRYREHYFAFEIYNYLKKDQPFRVRIFTDWACCKVQNYDEDEDSICDEIRYKLENEKGISFTEIAHKSIEIGRSELAMKLLEFEPSLSKKVPLLLWIGNRQSPQNCIKFFQKGVQDALKSRDLNLLFLAIRRIIQSGKIQKQQQIFRMFSRHIQGVYALINYFKLFNTTQLISYYGFLQQTQKIIMEHLRLGITDRKYDNVYKLLDMTRTLFNDWKGRENDWRKTVFEKTFAHFTMFLKHNDQIKFKNPKAKPVTLSNQMNFFMQRGDSDAVDDMKNEYRIDDKRVIMSKIKVLIDQNKYQDLLTFLQRHQKKYKIPVEMIADFLMKKRQVSWAMKVIARMPEKQKQEQYMLLQRTGKIRQAIDLAADRKDLDALQDIQETLLDSTLIAYCNEKIGVLSRKK